VTKITMKKGEIILPESNITSFL